MHFQLKTEYIELMALLKLMKVVSSGGEAGMLITKGEVKVNGNIELRKRAKIKKGDTVQYETYTIEII